MRHEIGKIYIYIYIYIYIFSEMCLTGVEWIGISISAILNETENENERKRNIYILQFSCFFFGDGGLLHTNHPSFRWRRRVQAWPFQAHVRPKPREPINTREYFPKTGMPYLHSAVYQLCQKYLRMRCSVSWVHHCTTPAAWRLHDSRVWQTIVQSHPGMTHL